MRAPTISCANASRLRSGSARELGCASAFLVHVHSRHTLLDQLGFGLNDVATRKAFCTAALVPLGYTAVMKGGGVVDAFYSASRTAGGKDNGAPGLRRLS